MEQNLTTEGKEITELVATVSAYLTLGLSRNLLKTVVRQSFRVRRLDAALHHADSVRIKRGLMMFRPISCHGKRHQATSLQSTLTIQLAERVNHADDGRTQDNDEQRREDKKDQGYDHLYRGFRGQLFGALPSFRA